VEVRLKAEDIGTIKRAEPSSSFCKSLLQEWKHKNMILRSQQTIVVTIQQRFTHQVLNTTLCAWKSVCRYKFLNREKQIADCEINVD
jgi:hypothetical protein